MLTKWWKNQTEHLEWLKQFLKYTTCEKQLACEVGDPYSIPFTSVQTVHPKWSLRWPFFRWCQSLHTRRFMHKPLHECFIWFLWWLHFLSWLQRLFFVCSVVQWDVRIGGVVLTREIAREEVMFTTNLPGDSNAGLETKLSFSTTAYHPKLKSSVCHAILPIAEEQVDVCLSHEH